MEFLRQCVARILRSEEVKFSEVTQLVEVFQVCLTLL